MSSCKVACSCSRKNVTLSNSAENKQTGTADLRPQTATVGIGVDMNNNFWDELRLFTKLSIKMVAYAKEQSLRNMTTSDDGTGNEEFQQGRGRNYKGGTFDGDITENLSYSTFNPPVGSSPVGSPVGSCPGGSPVGSSPRTNIGTPGTSRINCGVACCQCPVNLTSIRSLPSAGSPQAQSALSRSPSQRVSPQRPPVLHLNESLPSSILNYSQTRSPTGASRRTGLSRSGTCGSNPWSGLEGTGGFSGAFGGNLADSPQRTGLSRSGTCGSNPWSGLEGTGGLSGAFGGNLADSPQRTGLSRSGTCGSDPWGSFGGGGGLSGAFGGNLADSPQRTELSRSGTCGSDPWGNFGGGGGLSGASGGNFGQTSNRSGLSRSAHNRSGRGGIRGTFGHSRSFRSPDAGGGAGSDPWGAQPSAEGAWFPLCTPSLNRTNQTIADSFGPQGGQDFSLGGMYYGTSQFGDQDFGDDFGEFNSNPDAIFNVEEVDPLYANAQFDIVDNPSQDPEDWRNYDSSFPEPVIPYRGACLGAVHNTHEDICEMRTPPGGYRTPTRMNESPQSTCREPMFRLHSMYGTPGQHHSLPLASPNSRRGPRYCPNLSA